MPHGNDGAARPGRRKTMAENVTYREAFQRFDELLAKVGDEGRSYVIHDGERPLGALVPVETVPGSADTAPPPPREPR